MNQESYHPVEDRVCPIWFVIMPAFVGALLWLCAILSRMGMAW